MIVVSIEYLYEHLGRSITFSIGTFDRKRGKHDIIKEAMSEKKKS